MIDGHAALRDGRHPGDPGRARSPVLDLVLADLGITLDRWIVLNAVATESASAEIGLLVPALSAALDAPQEIVLDMLDDAEAGRHIRLVSVPSGDPAAARVELTTEGDRVHERLRAAVDELTRQARVRLERDLGVRASR